VSLEKKAVPADGKSLKLHQERGMEKGDHEHYDWGGVLGWLGSNMQFLRCQKPLKSEHEGRFIKNGAPFLGFLGGTREKYLSRNSGSYDE